MQTLTCKEALQLVLDQIDYTVGACSPTNMVAACLSTKVIELARKAIVEENK